MFVDLYGDTLVRIFYGEACSVIRFTHWSQSNPIGWICGERKGPSTGSVGGLGRFHFFHKMMICILVFLNSVDLGIAILK